MARYGFDGETVTLYLTDNDIDLLTSLMDQFVEMLGDGLPTPVDSDDPFALWEADLADDSLDAETMADPAVQRLFPNPYPQDPRAAHDFRRYAEPDHRRQKVTEATVVRQALETGPPVRISAAEVDVWLRTLNALRLVLATRLGVDDAEAMAELHQLRDTDPRAMMGAIMDWLAYLQGVIIELTEPGLDND